MNEKEIVNDYLTGINASLGGYAKFITETNCNELRSTLIDLRNQDEKRQYDLYQYAKKHGYYSPAPQASKQVIQTLKSTLSAT